MEAELPATITMWRSWPSRVRKHVSMAAAALALAALGSAAAWSVVPHSQRGFAPRTLLAEREQSLHRTSVHISEFTPVWEPLAPPPCGDERPPEALLTPDPLLPPQDDDVHVRVTFIIGADGQVHSPFILESGGWREDQTILRAVRHWRYRPALCDGVPIAAEARVRFARP